MFLLDIGYVKNPVGPFSKVLSPTHHTSVVTAIMIQRVIDIARVNKVCKVLEPGQSGDKWATGTTHVWSKNDNMGVMENYYTKNPSQRRYLQWMWDLWMFQKP